MVWPDQRAEYVMLRRLFPALFFVAFTVWSASASAQLAVAASTSSFYDPDALLWRAAVISNGGTVSTNRLTLVSLLIGGLKNAGTWSAMDDALVLSADNNTQALTSLKQRRLATEVNSPAFTANLGYQFNGTTSYLDTGFVPSTMAVSMTGTDMRAATYETVNVGATTYAMGVRNGVNQNIQLVPRAATGNANGNMDSASLSFLVGTSGIGYTSFSRPNSANLQAFHNGVNVGGPSAPGSTGSSLPTAAIFIGGYNSGGTLTTPRATTLVWVSWGASLTAAQEAAEYAVVQSYMVASFAVSTVTINDPSTTNVHEPHRIFNNGTATFTGTVAAVTSSAVDVKVTNAVGGATVVDWTTITSPIVSPNGSTPWSGTLAVPSGGPYKVQARLTANTLVTSAVIPNDFYVGRLASFIGESLEQFSWSEVDSPPPQQADIRRFTGGFSGGWPLISSARVAGETPGNHNGDGTVTLGNLMKTATGVPIGIIQLAIQGTTMAQWVSGGTAYPNFCGFNLWDFYVCGMSTQRAAPGWDVDMTSIRTGINDSEDGTPKATFKAELNQFLTDDRTEKANPNAPFAITITGRSTTATDASMDGIRQAEQEFIAENSFIWNAGNTIVLPLADTHHWTVAGRIIADSWTARTWENILGIAPCDARGPLPGTASAAAGTNTITITPVTTACGTTLLDGAGSSTGAITGLRFTLNGTLMPVASATLAANVITLVYTGLPLSLSDTACFDYQYGANPNVGNPVYDNDTVAGTSAGLPMQPTQGCVSVSIH